MASRHTAVRHFGGQSAGRCHARLGMFVALSFRLRAHAEGERTKNQRNLILVMPKQGRGRCHARQTVGMCIGHRGSILVAFDYRETGALQVDGFVLGPPVQPATTTAVSKDTSVNNICLVIHKHGLDERLRILCNVYHVLLHVFCPACLADVVKLCLRACFACLHV